MLQVKTFELEGHEYELTQLGALEARFVQARLAGILGVAAKAFATADSLDERAMANGIQAVLGALTPEAIEDLTDRFMPTTRVRTGADQRGNPTWARLSDNSKQIFNLHFAGRMFAMDRWLWECLRFNFSDFLEKAEVTDLLDLATRSVSRSPTESIGSSGE